MNAPQYQYRATVLPLSTNERLSAFETAAVMRNVATNAAQGVTRGLYPNLAHTFAEIQASYPQNQIKASAKCAAIFSWVKKNIIFVEDAASVAPWSRATGVRHGVFADSEVLIHPEVLVQTKTGDCDDFCTLTMALCMLWNLPVATCMIAADPEMPNRLSHVYCLAGTEKGTMPLDTSHGSFAGWEYLDITDKVIV